MDAGAAMGRQKDLVLQLLEKAELRARALTDAAAAVRETAEAVAAGEASMRSELAAFFSSYRRAVDAREAELLQELGAVSTRKKHELDKQLQELHLASASLQTGVEEVAKLNQLDAPVRGLVAATRLRQAYARVLQQNPELVPRESDDVVLDSSPESVWSGELRVLARLRETKPSPPHCDAGGDGLRIALLGVPTKFWVALRDRHGQPAAAKRARLSVKIKRGTMTSAVQLHADDSGMASVVYTLSAAEAGYVSLAVFLGRQHVRGSPFLVQVDRQGFRFARSLGGNVASGNQLGEVDKFDEGTLSCPSFACCDGECIFVADDNRCRIVCFNTIGVHLGAWGRRGSRPGEFLFTGGLACDDQAVYVADFGNHRLQVFLKDGSFLRQWGGEGSGLGRFLHPFGVACDDECVYVADRDNSRVQMFSKDGSFVRAWGSPGPAAGCFAGLTGVCCDEKYVFTCETDNHRVQIFRKSGSWVRMWGSRGSGPGELTCPRGIAVTERHVFVTDKFKLHVFRKNGQYVRSVGQPGTGQGELDEPFGVCVDAHTVFVVDSNNNRVQAFHLAKKDEADEAPWSSVDS